MVLNVGDVAPDFKLSCAIGSKKSEFHLASQRGKNVVVVFYPLDFTPV
jgi:glutaredoxin-dependent peroxiredoxin